MLYQKEMLCKIKELVSTYEELYKVLQPMGYKPGYRDHINTISKNGWEVETPMFKLLQVVFQAHPETAQVIQGGSL
jgi:hypothetical protein